MSSLVRDCHGLELSYPYLLGVFWGYCIGEVAERVPAGLWVLGRRRWLEASVGVDLPITGGGPRHQFIGSAVGVRLDPADLLVEGGAHRIDPTSSSDFEPSYEASTVVLPYLGMRLGLSWGRLPLIRMWATVRFILARMRTSVVESGTRPSDSDGCYFGPPSFAVYREESHWNLGGSSFAAGVRVGFWPFGLPRPTSPPQNDFNHSCVTSRSRPDCSR